MVSTIYLNYQGGAVAEKQKIYVVYGEIIPKRPVVVFDIDGVLVDCGERLEKSLEEAGATKDDLEHNPEARRKFWKVFLSEKYLHLDRPVDAAVELLRERKKSYGVVIVTGRPETLLRATIKQLEGFGIPFDAVVFRAQGYYGKDHEYKAVAVESMGLDVVEAHDDSADVCAKMLYLSSGGVFWWHRPGQYLYLPPLVATVNGRKIRFDREIVAEQLECSNSCIIEYAGAKYTAKNSEEALQVLRRLKDKVLAAYASQDVFKSPMVQGEVVVLGKPHPTPLPLKNLTPQDD